jgi:hypothetical protein
MIPWTIIGIILLLFFSNFLSLHHPTILVMITLLFYFYFLLSMLRFLLNIKEKKLETDFYVTFFGFWKTFMDLLPCLYPELRAFNCKDTLTKVIYYENVYFCSRFKFI